MIVDKFFDEWYVKWGILIGIGLCMFEGFMCSLELLFVD